MITKTYTLEEEFAADTILEVESARKKFPSPEGLMTALTEEVGEVARAVMDESWGRVRRECIQVAAMAMRLALEGDPTLSELREKRSGMKDMP